MRLSSAVSRATRRPVAIALSLAMLLVTWAWLEAAPSHAAGEVYSVPASGAWTIEGAGYGHGIGLSQWGAQGAALSGLRPDQIMTFYYPGTAFGHIGNPDVRVQLTDYQGSSIVFGPYANEQLTATDLATGHVQTLPPASRYRLTLDSTSLHLSLLAPDATWQPVAVSGQTDIAGPIDIKGPSGTWAYSADLSGSGRQYWGTLRLARTSASSAQAINILSLDTYLKFVVPRESPSWFQAGALQAQAIAARSYARSVSTPSGQWDICDTTQCQVYGGRAVAAPGGAVTWLESSSTSTAVDATSGIVMVDGAGQVAFTQFSSSNGGYSVAGSKPYLIAQPDPYSGKDPHDTSTRWTDKLQAATVQQKCPSGTLQSFEITGRDGRGPFGGRITSIKVNCTGGSATITNTNDLAFGMKHRMWHVTGTSPDAAVAGNLEVLAANSGGIYVKGWASGRDGSTAKITVAYQTNHAVAKNATGSRPDVANAYPVYGAAHGFDFTVPAVSGNTQVCVYADAVGTSTTLGCGTVNPPAGAPFGHLDEVSGVAADGNGPLGLLVRGWAIDPNTTNPIDVHLYFATDAVPVTANGSRPDVAKVYPSSGPNHGFTARLAVPAGSSGQLCAYAINVPAPGGNPILGCAAYTVPAA